MRFLLAILFTSTAFAGISQITFYEVFPDSQLVDGLLSDNHSSFNVQYSGFAKSIAGFEMNHSNIEIDRGILLSTGYADGSDDGPIGPNDAQDHGKDVGTPGSALIESEFSGGQSFNAAVLEFDFIAGADSLELEFVFASEEYHEFVSTNFGDGIAIQLAGPGVQGIANLAVVPGTNLPIGINNVNNGTSNNGPCQNCNYLNPNVSNDQVLQYDAYTVSMFAKHDLVIGEQYHMAIIIADFSDADYDSGLLIAGCETCQLGNEEIAFEELRVFPNPTSSQLNVSLKNAGAYEFRIVSLSGQEAMSGSFNGTNLVLNVAELGSGHYLFELSNENGIAKALKFTVD